MDEHDLKDQPDARRARGRGEADLAALHLGRKLWLARLALLWEHAWPALWPALGIGGAFAALALFDVLPGLPAWLHGLILAAFAGAFGYALWRAGRALRLPGESPARRRIETVSGYVHRPLTLARDDIAGGRDDPETRALWALHRRRVLERIRALRVGLPAPGLARRDPWAVRGALLVVLVVGLVVAWGDGYNRLARALAPGVGGALKGPAVVDVWITPPAYTGLPPIFLSTGTAGKGPGPAPRTVNAGGTQAGAPQAHRPALGGDARAEAPVAIPEGSTILVQLSGGWGTPRLALGALGAEFESVADGTWKASAAVGLDPRAERLTIRQGTTQVAGWPVRIVPDRVPTIRFADVPAPGNRGAMRVTVEGEDDYGFAEAQLFVSRPRAAFDLPPGASEEEAAALARFNAPEVIGLSLPGNARTLNETSYHDLTASPWAGTEVTMQVLAHDGAGQPAATEAVSVILPERYFRHPVARALVMLRKKLMLEPSARADIVDELFNLSTIPGSFNHDSVVFLAIQTSAHRLRDNPGIAVVDEVQKLMWETALRIEDGQLSLAEQRMRELQKKLMEALNNKDAAEIEKLMRELEQAMAEFLKELMQGMENMPDMARPFDPNTQSLSPQDLQRMLDRARELAMTGNMDAARQMLSMLRELLENLREGRMAEGQNRQNQEAWNMLRELQDMMKRQQELMDDTFRESQPGMREGEQRPSPEDLARRQEQLQRDLQDMLRRFGEMQGELPKSLGDAELAMREALRELERRRPGDAVPPQGRALEEMQRGAGEMAQQLMQQYGQGRGRGPGQGRAGRMMPGGVPMAVDPLGRPLPNAGQSSSEDVVIPDESDTQRAREILEELRRRAGELGRPPVEMDYIERLLRRF